MGGPGAVPPGRDNPDYARMLRGGILGDLSVLFWYCSRLKNGKRLLGGILFRLFAAAASGGKFGSIRQPQGYLKNFGMLRPLAAHAGVERRFTKALLRSFLKPRFIVLGHSLACSRGPAVSKKPRYHALGGSKTAVLIHGGKHSFQRIAQHAVAITSPLAFFSSSQFQQGNKPNLSCPLRKAYGTHQMRPHLGQLAFASIRKPPI